MSAGADQSILDLIRPPEGYRFGLGVWITHDLCTGALVDLVLPALAGIGASERRVRRSAPSALLDAHLVIIAASDRVSNRAMPPTDLVTMIPLPGRRLHAKFLVLQYERLEDHPLHEIGAKHISKRISRAIVTSANLTKGGLSRNREIWASQDTPSTAGAATSLCRDLAPLAQRLLVGEAKTATFPTARDIISSLGERLPKGTTKSYRVAHSLTGIPKNGLGLLATTGLVKSPTRRVAIVTPAFASEGTSGAISPFGQMLKDATVDLYLAADRTREQIDAGARVAFSSAVVKQIRARADQLRVWAVPVDEPGDDGTPVTRRLHAKVIVVLDKANDVHVLVGSANLTTRGMAGLNRELLVHDVLPDGGDAAFDSVTESLDAIRIPDDRLDPAPAQEKDDLPQDSPPGPALVAFFTPDRMAHAGMHRLHGMLLIVGDLQAVTQVRSGESKLEVVATQSVILDADAPVIQVCVKRRWFDVPITNSAPLDDSFWDAQAIEADHVGQNPDVFRLLADLTRSIKRRGQTGGKAASAATLGKFTLPYERRLPALAKAIPHLRSTYLPTRKFLDQMLDEYFDKHADERAIATVLADAIYGEPYRGGERLLGALHAQVQDVPQESG